MTVKRTWWVQTPPTTSSTGGEIEKGKSVNANSAGSNPTNDIVNGRRNRKGKLVNANGTGSNPAKDIFNGRPNRQAVKGSNPIGDEYELSSFNATIHNGRAANGIPKHSDSTENACVSDEQGNDYNECNSAEVDSGDCNKDGGNNESDCGSDVSIDDCNNGSGSNDSSSLDSNDDEAGNNDDDGDGGTYAGDSDGYKSHKGTNEDSSSSSSSNEVSVSCNDDSSDE